MATNDFDSDAMLAFFAQLGKEIDSLKTKISGLNESGGSGLNKAADAAERFGNVMKKHHREAIQPMTSSIKDLTLSLAGPVGLAYGVYQVAKSFEAFAVAQIRIQNFARDTGFTTTAVKQVQVAAQHMGYTVEEANGYMAKFGGLVNDLRVNKMGSQLWQSFAQLPRGGTAFANELERMATAGKSYEEILTRISQEVKKQEARGPEGQRAAMAIAERAGLPLSFLEKYEENKKKVGTVHTYTDEERAEQQQLNDKWIDMEERFYADWEKTKTAGIKALLAAESLYRAAMKPDAWDKVKSGYDKAIQAGKDAASKAKPLDVDERDPATGLPYDNSLDQSQVSPKVKFPKLQLWKRGEGDDTPLDQSQVSPSLFKRSSADDGDGATLPKGARPTSFDPKALHDTEKDSNKLLQDIRDTLFHMDNPNGGVPGGGGGGGDGGGGGTTFRRGIRGGGGGGGGGDGGGTGDIEVGPTGSDAVGGRAYLFSQRERFKKEFEANPQLKLRAAAILSLENEGAKTGVLESMYNRANIPGHRQTAEHALAGGPHSFYGPARHPGMVEARMRALQSNPKHLERLNRLIEESYYSNLIKSNTDQGSAGDPNYIAGGTGVNINRERFNDWGVSGSRQFRLNQERAIAEADARAKEQRDKIDRASVANKQHLGTADINVMFGNVPAGTKTDATMDSGVFKTLRLSRSGQAAMAGSSAAPQNNWSMSE